MTHTNRNARPARALVLLAVALVPALRVQAEDLNQKVERLETELRQLKAEIATQKPTPEASPVPATATPTPTTAAAAPAYRAVLDRVQLGGYGSLRFAASDLKNQKDTFTFRRFVLTTDANIAPRLRAYAEVEFERFRKLGFEKGVQGTANGVAAMQDIEATDDSEISLEQGWLQYDLQDWLRLRAGAILVPLGRFNISHDDNRWDLPRRSLVDRGVPVLPSTAAWDELGLGFNGDVPFGETLLGSYQLYVVNGVSLSSEIQTLVQTQRGGSTLVVDGVEVSPSTGTFAEDTKDAKALSGRFALSPALGDEVGASFYWGRYTPDFLPNEDLYALSADGLYTLGPFELEGEYVFTHFGGVEDVARGFANAAVNGVSTVQDGGVQHEVDFALAELASDKQGYWIDLRYRFWPRWLSRTVLGSPFEHPQLVAVLRGEQAWLGGLVRSAAFDNGTLTDFATANRRVDRLTLGLAYRPVPQVVFQLAYEYTQTNAGQSLADVTNFLPAQAGEDHVHTLMLGTAFGF